MPEATVTVLALASYKDYVRRLLILLAVSGLLVSGCGSASPVRKAEAAAKCLRREGWSVQWSVEREMINGTHRSPPEFVARRSGMSYAIAFPGSKTTPVGWTGYAPLSGRTPVALAGCVRVGEAVVARTQS
jgi:hypothetical protein